MALGLRKREDGEEGEGEGEREKEEFCRNLTTIVGYEGLGRR